MSGCLTIVYFVDLDMSLISYIMCWVVQFGCCYPTARPPAVRVGLFRLLVRFPIRTSLFDGVSGHGVLQHKAGNVSTVQSSTRVVRVENFSELTPFRETAAMSFKTAANSYD
jgi:hypothetical protein